jgi:acid phosphatase (class A)
MQFRPVTATLLACSLLGAACTTPPTTSPEVVGELRAGTGILKGYLPSADLPDSLALVAPPPAAGTPQALADENAFRNTVALRNSPRWNLAARDADLTFPQAANSFSCALGMPISAQDTPQLNMLLRRTLTDAGLATYRAKDHYQRTRPFVALSQPSCTPAEEAMLAKDGSYPSGHSAVGWAFALVLTEIAPQRANALLARGYAYGQSRVICGVHWQSDVEAGRLVAAATVARLHADPVFRAQMAAAGEEVTRGLSKNAPAQASCAAEAAALAR